MKCGSLISLWNFFKKVYFFRRRAEGGHDTSLPQEQPAGPEDKSVESLLGELKALQKGQHTLDLACTIFGDLRVRTLGYMFLIFEFNKFVFLFIPVCYII